jgi:GNAT superfamily N-acetyltransferase
MMVTIIEFEKKHADAFRSLNEEWLNRFHLMESHDREVLDDPEGMVIGRGGFIFLAEAEGKIIGTAGLMKDADGEFELVKMAVDPRYQGRGVSKMLIEKCIEKAKHVYATRIFLYSNSQLQRAIGLYTKYGFRHISAEGSPFETADVKMEIRF